MSNSNFIRYLAVIICAKAMEHVKTPSVAFEFHTQFYFTPVLLFLLLITNTFAIYNAQFFKNNECLIFSIYLPFAFIYFISKTSQFLLPFLTICVSLIFYFKLTQFGKRKFGQNLKVLKINYFYSPIIKHFS